MSKRKEKKLVDIIRPENLGMLYPHLDLRDEFKQAILSLTLLEKINLLQLISAFICDKIYSSNNDLVRAGKIVRKELIGE